MFCYQCEQTDRSNPQAGCATAKGHCGKDATTADLQDLLVHALKGIAQYSLRARTLGTPDNAAGGFLLYGMFTTLTNVNFNAARFVALLKEAAQVRDRAKAGYEAAAIAQGQAFIMQSVLATSLIQGQPEPEMVAKEWDVNGKKALLAIRKA